VITSVNGVYRYEPTTLSDASFRLYSQPMTAGVASLILLFAAMTVASGISVPLSHLRSGRATVHYFHPPDVVLDIRLASGKMNRIPLTYEEVGQQRRDDIWKAEVLTEEPGHFIIFTDRFSSNSNIQGQCGASDGEQYLHVVSLAAPMRETLSLNIDSCYQFLKPVFGYPKYNPVTRILSVKIEHEDTDTATFSRYRISNDGEVEPIS
jgi:hypothetical protein